MARWPRIAIVDDDQWIRRSLETLLKSAGLRAEAFISAEDYLAAGKHEETGWCRPLYPKGGYWDGRKLAKIILDIGLPGMNGFELERRLTADRNPRPIVFV